MRLNKRELAVKQAIEDLGGDINFFNDGGRIVVPFDAYDTDHIDDVLRDTGYYIEEALPARNRKIDGVLHAKVMVIMLTTYNPEEDNQS